MMNGIVTQIVTVVFAIGIILTYVQPTFKAIGETQDNIVTYQQEREKIKGVNQQLTGLVSRMNSVSLDDEKRLLAYLPDEIDEVYIQRDLILISQVAGISTASIAYGAAKSSQEGSASSGSVHGFTLTFDSTYEQLKQILILLEQNEYPLQVTEASATLLEGGFLSVTLNIKTYTHELESGSSNNNNDESEDEGI